MNNITSYRTITELPQKNIEYLSSGLAASNCEYMFTYCNKLEYIPWNEFNIDTSQCTNMGDMFYECAALTSLDLSSLDTSQVTYTRYMFKNCTALTSLNLSNFNTSKVTDMDQMFYGCEALTSLNLSNFNTSQVTNMRYMFYGCDALTSLDLSNFDTSKVINMYEMFYSCNALTSLNLSNFDTSKVTNMGDMFRYCESLQEIICPNGFDMSSCTLVRYMFQNCNSYNGEPLHFKNVLRNLDFSDIRGTEGVHYVIDNYID